MIYGTRLTFFLLKANAHRCSLAVAVTCKSSHNTEWAITIIKSAQSCSITMVKDHSDLQPSILPAAAFTHGAQVYTLRTALELLMPLSMNKWQVKQLGGWGFLCWLFLPHSNFHNLRLKLGFSYSQHMKVHSGEKWGFQSEQVQLLNALGPLGKFTCSSAVEHNGTSPVLFQVLPTCACFTSPFLLCGLLCTASSEFSLSGSTVLSCSRLLYGKAVRQHKCFTAFP